MKTCVLVACALALGAHADFLTQIDTFDTTTEGWAGGANTTHVQTGPGEGYLQLSRPIEATFHIAGYNTAQWTGDLLADGVTALTMDLAQIAGPAALSIRLMVWGDGGLWGSTAITPITSSWTTYTFGLTAADLSFVNADMEGPAGSGGGTGVLADTLSGVNRIQIRHDGVNPTPPGFHPPHVAATLGIDNIAAIPEPASLAYLLTAGMGLYLYRSKLGRS